MTAIRKALFPVAGLGTRMLPASKAIPKELLPVYDTPILDLLVSECIDAGIDEIILVTSREKYLIENYFDSFPELESKLRKKGDLERLAQIQKFQNIQFSSVRQGEQHGDGHAMLQAQHLLQNEPFLVIFGDELIFGSPSSVEQLITAYQQTESCVIGVRQVPKADISSYGVVDTISNTPISRIQGVVEKPKAEDAPSDKAVIGKYVCTPDIWEALTKAGMSHGGEMRLIDGFAELLKNKTPISSCMIEGTRFDTGSSKGYAMANIYMALQRGEICIEEVIEMAKKSENTFLA